MLQLHNRCASQFKRECNLGDQRVHVLPPTAICPIILDRQRSITKEKRDLHRSESTPGGLSEGTVSDELDCLKSSLDVHYYCTMLHLTLQLVRKYLGNTVCFSPQ